ncbi:unnamed protein product [Blepharisma stoltei]|uniref:BTB domain-containing protein n=1 Tax=Blepharisma stoltei TaxID=1481888 RepID=A0AAU9ITU5_9CILI|nr:unnamed protein product [Blepharisma stoltei]
MSMFGISQPQSQPQPQSQSSGGLFGQAAPAQSSLFSNIQQPVDTSSVFGNANQQPSSQGGFFGSSNINSQAFPQQSQSLPQNSFPPAQPTCSSFSFSNATPQPPQPPQSLFLPVSNSDNPISLAQPPQSKIQLVFTNDSQSLLNAKPYGLNIAVGTSEKPAEFTIIVNGTDTFMLSSEILKERSYFFKKELEGENMENLKLEISIPFPNMLLDFFLWLHYQDQGKLLQKIHFLHEMLEIYAIGRIFQIKPELGLGELLLRNRNISSCLPFQQLPDVWDRKYIDFKFLTKMLNQSAMVFSGFGGFGGGLFGTPDDGKIYAVFDWLGEKSCYCEEDIEDLKNSDDFKNMGKELERNNYLPKNINSYAQLAIRYPVAIQTISITRLLKGINLI